MMHPSQPPRIPTRHDSIMRPPLGLKRRPWRVTDSEPRRRAGDSRMTASPAESGRFHMETPEAGTWFGILKGTAIMICEMTDGTWTVWDAGIQRSSNDEELSLDEAALWAIRYAAMKGGSRA